MSQIELWFEVPFTTIILDSYAKVLKYRAASHLPSDQISSVNWTRDIIGRSAHRVKADGLP